MDFKSNVGIPMFSPGSLGKMPILKSIPRKKGLILGLLNTIVLILALLDLIKILTSLAIFWDRGTVTRQVFPGQTLIDVVLKEFRKSLLITEIRCFSFQSLFGVVKLIQKIHRHI